MSKNRDIRRLAMQVLYEMDMNRVNDARKVDHDFDPPDVCKPAIELATAAWQDHERSDELITSLAPKWPPSRQPPVDRAILRLAYHEIHRGRTPVKVAINEAIELAKAYGAKESAAFINGVLDKVAKTIGQKLNVDNK